MKLILSTVILLTNVGCLRTWNESSARPEWAIRGVFSKERVYQFYVFQNNSFCLYEDTILNSSLKAYAGYSESTGLLDDKTEKQLAQTLFKSSKPVNLEFVSMNELKQAAQQSSSTTISAVGGFIMTGSLPIGIMAAAASSLAAPLVIVSAGFVLGMTAMSVGAGRSEAEEMSIQKAGQKLEESAVVEQWKKKPKQEQLKQMEALHRLVSSIDSVGDAECPNPSQLIAKELAHVK